MSFENEICDFWAARFGLEPEQLMPGKTLIAFDHAFDTTGQMVLYTLPQGSFLRIGTKTAMRFFGANVKHQGDALTVKELVTLLNYRGVNLLSHSVLYDYFVNPHTFTPFEPADVFCALVDPLEHAADMDKLFAACTEEELDDADIDLETPDNDSFGIYDGDDLVAYASYRTFDRNLVDVGVLVHPAYRGRGYARAVVSSVTTYGLLMDKVPMYRVFSTNTASIKIPEALGYARLLTVDSLKVD